MFTESDCCNYILEHKEKIAAEYHELMANRPRELTDAVAQWSFSVCAWMANVLIQTGIAESTIAAAVEEYMRLTADRGPHLPTSTPVWAAVRIVNNLFRRQSINN